MAFSPDTYNSILLGAQAAGIATDFYSQRQARKAAQAGYGLDEGELQLRMQEEQMAFTQANTENLERLRETLSTQNAILGARGQMAGVGSALASQTKAVGEYSADKEAMRLSKLFRENQFKGMQRLSKIKQAGSRIESGNRMLQSGLNMFSLSESLYSKKPGASSKSIGTGTPAYKKLDLPSLRPNLGTRGK